MKKTLVLYDEDEIYAKRLADYINMKEEAGFSVQVFTDMEKLTDCCRDSAPDVMLVTDKADEKAVDGVRAGVKLYLGDRNAEIDGMQYINKYQSAEQIIRIIISKLPEAAMYRREAYTNRKSRLIGVYSPVGRCGKTTFALIMGQLLSRSQRVLYISFEEFSTVNSLIPTPSGECLSDAYFYYSQHTLKEHINEITGQWHDLNILAGVRCPQDLKYLGADVVEAMLEEIFDTGYYDTVVADFGSALTEGAKLLGMCSVVYMPGLDEPVSRGKISAFRKWLENDAYGFPMSRLAEISMPEILQKDTQSMYLEHQLWGKVGDYIRSIAGMQ